LLRLRSERRARSTVLRILGAPLLLAAGASEGSVLPPDRADTGDIDSPRIDLVIAGNDPTVSGRPASPPASVNIT